MIRGWGAVKPIGVTYHELQMFVVAIDGAAHVITGRPYYFSAHGSGTTEGELVADARHQAFERGEGKLL